MMKHLKLFSESDLASLVVKRKGEIKFGEHIQLIPHHTSIYDSILNLDVQYVIFGICEDIGVFANGGKTGTSKAWPVVLKNLLNIQSNGFFKAKNVAILGHLDYTEVQTKLDALDASLPSTVTKARKKVVKIDEDVSYLVYQIVKAGKIPIVIGGGHNNAYGCLKGTSLALNSPINAVNFDAHTDFRPLEGRHSGNGFSYAYAEGFLKNYFIFGLHENYTSHPIIKTINKLKNVQFNTYEAVRVRKELSFNKELSRALDHVNNTFFGIEIDLDAIRHVNTSAKTPSGYSSDKARTFLNFTAKHANVKYLHICEGIPEDDNDTYLGKLICFLITDFFKATGG